MAASPREEYIVGDIPSRSTDYDENEYPSPTWDDLVHTLQRERIASCYIVAIGKVNYPGKNPVTGVGGVTGGPFTRQDIVNVPTLQADKAGIPREGMQRGLVGARFLRAITSYSTDPEMTATLTQTLLGLSLKPLHIAAFAVKVIAVD